MWSKWRFWWLVIDQYLRPVAFFSSPNLHPRRPSSYFKWLNSQKHAYAYHDDPSCSQNTDPNWLGKKLQLFAKGGFVVESWHFCGSYHAKQNHSWSPWRHRSCLFSSKLHLWQGIDYLFASRSKLAAFATSKGISESKVRSSLAQVAPQKSRFVSNYHPLPGRWIRNELTLLLLSLQGAPILHPQFSILTDNWLFGANIRKTRWCGSRRCDWHVYRD
jgi:hypothetical protein